ncbi:MAG: hypothetical protein AB7G06_09010 [Bdellovibrionales bacterium]
MPFIDNLNDAIREVCRKADGAPVDIDHSHQWIQNSAARGLIKWNNPEGSPAAELFPGAEGIIISAEQKPYGAELRLLAHSDRWRKSGAVSDAPRPFAIMKVSRINGRAQITQTLIAPKVGRAIANYWESSQFEQGRKLDAVYTHIRRNGVEQSEFEPFNTCTRTLTQIVEKAIAVYNV